MASPATPAPRTSARSRRSMFGDPRTGRKLVASCVLALMPLLVRWVMARADAARLSHEQDQADRTCKVRRGLDTALADLTNAETRQRGLPITGHGDYPAPLIAARPAVADDVDTVRDQIRSLTTSVQAGEGGLPGDRRADSASATQTTRTTLIVAGLVELLVMAGPATVIARSISGPLRRTVRVLQEPADGRFDRRRPPSSAEESATPAGVVAAAAEQVPASKPTVATGTGEAGASIREIARDAVEAGQVAARAVSGALEMTAASVTRRGDSSAAMGNVVKAITSIAQQTRLLARDATIQGARVGGADRDFAVVANQVARAADLATTTAASTLTARPVRATVYAAARSRAYGPTTALWHAVELHRPVGTVDGACEVTVCGSLVRVSAEQTWPLAARDVCPTCATLAQ